VLEVVVVGQCAGSFLGPTLQLIGAHRSSSVGST
jgi:hypothetical protein